MMIAFVIAMSMLLGLGGNSSTQKASLATATFGGGPNGGGPTSGGGNCVPGANCGGN